MFQIYGDRWVDVTVDLPPLDGDGIVTVAAPSSVRINCPRVVVGPDDLAVDVSQSERDTTIRVGRVSGATLVLPVRAAVPVREREMTIRVSAAGDGLILPLVLVGTVRLLPARNQWQMPSAFTIGRTSECVLHLRNDGTVPLEQAVVRVPIPRGVLVSGEDSRELRLHQRIAVVRVGSLGVGEARDVTLNLTVLDATVSEVRLVAEVSGRDFQATFAGEVVPVEPPGQVRLLVERIDKHVARVGDVVRFTARIENGAATSQGAELRVHGDGVVPRNYPLGTFFAGEMRDLPVPVTISRAGVGEWTESVVFELHDERGCAGERTCEIACIGEPVLIVGAAIGPADATIAHPVAVRIDNFGDAQAANTRLRAKRIGDVKAVVDSLRINGKPRFAVDGAVPIFDEGVDLGTLNSGEACEVHFLIRSGAGVHDALTFYVAEASGVEATASVDVEIQPSLSRERGTVGDEPLAVRAPEPTLGPVADSFEALAAHLQTTIGSSTEEQPQPDETATATEDEPAAIEYPTQWDGNGLLYAGDGNVELGRHVLALYSWLPCNARDERVRAAVEALRTETQIVQMQYLAGLKAGMFGVSGYSFAPSSVMAALKQYREAVGEDLDGPVDELSAVNIVASLSVVPEHLEPWRSAVVSAIAAACDAEAFGDIFSFPIPEQTEVAA